MSKTFNSKQKIAALLLAFGEGVAGEILKNLTKKDVTEILSAMQQLGRVEEPVLEALVQEFYLILSQDQTSLTGNQKTVNKFIDQAFKGEDAEKLKSFVAQSLPGLPALEGADPVALARLIRHEHPQTITIVLACCNPVQGSALLKALPPSIHTEILRRLASLGQVSAEVLDELNESLKHGLESAEVSNRTDLGGPEKIVKALAKLDKEAAAQMLSNLELRDPELAEQVRTLMFVFEDLRTLPANDLRLVVQKSPQKTLLLAMRGSSSEFQNAIYGCLSGRASELLRDDFEASKPSPKKDVLEAQKQIMDIYQKLLDSGTISSPDGEMV